MKINGLNEKEIMQSTVSFFAERFNAEVSVFTEDDQAKYDPKNRSPMAMPNQPAIFIE